jgi:hypothetical protein
VCNDDNFNCIVLSIIFFLFCILFATLLVHKNILACDAFSCFFANIFKV